jgi:hypothetical protein
MSTSKCAQCNETVYPLERQVLAEKVFHKGCAKCSHCQNVLTISSFASANGKLFCKPHYLELFKSSGGKYAFAGSFEVSASASETIVVAPEPTKVLPKEKKESTPKKLSKVASMLSGNGPASAEKADKSTKKDASKGWAKSLFGQAKQEKTNGPEQPADEKKEQVVTLSTQSASAKPIQIEQPAHQQSKQQHSKPANKLAAFLSSAPDTALVASAEPVDVPQEVLPQPVRQQQQAPASGMSKLSMFLQQVEAPGPAALLPTPVKPRRESAPNEVPEEKQAPVSELIKKSEAPKTEQVKSDIAQTPVKAQQPRAQPSPPKQQESQGEEVISSVSSSLRGKLAQAKRSVPASNQLESLQIELEHYKSKCSAMEEEVETLRARVDLSDAGKEALVQEIARLNAALEAATNKKPTTTKPGKAEPVVVEANENMVENSLKHAKKLLSQGKITKAQYDAAAKACVEASRVVAGN